MPPPPPLPDDPPGLIVQAAAHLIADGQAAVAAARLEALVAVAPAYPAAHVLLARALEATGREVEALAAWHRAHFLVPNSPLVQRERARLTAALAAAPQSTPAADGATEPEALAAAPGGALPDAHLAFVAEEEIPEEAPDEVPAEPEDASSEAPEAAGDEAPPGPEEPDEDAPIEVEVMAPDAREGEAPTDGPPDP
ncbi:MAG: tetratricopeptide repeat protein, partial [Rubricoccaceae bacterium]|nr:tetratricopeptide repeat protein [Rubricoccaceae bacterium]